MRRISRKLLLSLTVWCALYLPPVVSRLLSRGSGVVVGDSNEVILLTAPRPYFLKNTAVRSGIFTRF